MKRIHVVVLTIVLIAFAVIPVLAQGVYPAWHQGFEQGTGSWISDDTPGPAGWCGDIAHFERGEGPVSPSVGNGYAVVSNGACNDHWMNNGWLESGPYSPFGGYSGRWPQSGFVVSIDIYLDPGWGEGTDFDYYLSFNKLDDPTYPFRYFVIPVSKQGGQLLVLGSEVGEAGWYTFSVKFGEDGEHLSVEFELKRHGQVLLARPMPTTIFTGEATSSFDVANVGTGYSWFDSISAGLQLPIDQHMYRPGQ